MPPSSSLDIAKQFDALEREIDAMFRAADRRIALRAAAAARELHLDRLAERFMAEAEGRSYSAGNLNPDSPADIF